MGKRLGILGGTFDPVHLGHVHCALAVMSAKDLDKLIMVPAATPPHKDQKMTSAFPHRYHMLQLQLEAYPSLVVSDIENQRQGPSFTVHSLRLLCLAYPDDQLFFIIGEDNLPTLHTWYDYKSLIEENDFICMRRAGESVERNDCLVLTDHEYEKLTANKVKTPLIEISSTAIRKSFKEGSGSVAKFLMPEVVAYIREHKLYQ